MSREDDIRCRTCIWWTEGAPPTATATRNNRSKPGVGTCEVRPPAVVATAGMPFTYFPETHEDRHCGAWESREGDGDGGEELPTGEVIPLRREAA